MDKSKWMDIYANKEFVMENSATKWINLSHDSIAEIGIANEIHFNEFCVSRYSLFVVIR